MEVFSFDDMLHGSGKVPSSSVYKRVTIQSPTRDLTSPIASPIRNAQFDDKQSDALISARIAASKNLPYQTNSFGFAFAQKVGFFFVLFFFFENFH